MADVDDARIDAARAHVRRLETQLALTNVAASAAIVATSRYRRWFERYPDHPARLQTMAELERIEQTARADFAMANQGLQRARAELDALFHSEHSEHSEKVS